jgi:hypothetical protein
MLAASDIRKVMEAVSTSEMSVDFYQTTRRNNPEDGHRHTRRCENMRSHKDDFAGHMDRIISGIHRVLRYQ